MSTTKLSSVAEREDGSSSGGTLMAVTTKGYRPTTIRASKWGRILGSSSLDSGSETNNTSSSALIITRSMSARDHAGGNGKDKTVYSSSSGSGPNPVNGAGSGNKVFPKLQKVTTTTTTSMPSSGGNALEPHTTRQDTIEEIVELDDRGGGGGGGGASGRTGGTYLRKIDSYDSGILRSEQKLNEVSSCGLMLYSQHPTTPVPAGIAATEYKELLANIMDFKVDVKLEVQRLNQKVGRMEELLTEIMSRLSPPGQNSTSSTASQSPPQEVEATDITGAQQKTSKSGTTRSSSAFALSSSSTRDVNDRPMTASGTADGLTLVSGSGMGSLILRKRRSKSRNKAAAPSVPTSSTGGVSPRTSPTETTKMLEEHDQGNLLVAPSTSRADEEKRPFRRSREFL
uniref:Uncharacterized protein n=1 Tax=Timema shepardi TaxID=629360 RepID=A0A7R9AP80_TIMSH|nr:unnamed protein product [Timema shepardi]